MKAVEKGDGQQLPILKFFSHGRKGETGVWGLRIRVQAVFNGGKMCRAHCKLLGFFCKAILPPVGANLTPTELFHVCLRRVSSAHTVLCDS